MRRFFEPFGPDNPPPSLAGWLRIYAVIVAAGLLVVLVAEHL